MPDFSPILVHAMPFMLVLTRISGLFLFTPLLTSDSIPRSFKTLLAFTFSLAIYPFVPQAALPVDITMAELLPFMFSELLIGIILGLIMSIPMMAVQMGGYMMGYQMGLALAESFNPELNTNSSAIGQLLFYLSIFIYIGIGGFEIMFVTLADSFYTIGSGTFSVADTPLNLLLDVINSGFELAIRVASPILGVISMLLIAMGFMMKTMPQMNIMSVGFAIQIVAGLTMLMLTVGVIGSVAGDEVLHVLTLLQEWVYNFARTPHG